MKIISETYFTKINSILDNYISKKELGEDIYSPLNKLLDDVKNLNESAFNRLDRNFLEKSKEDSASNFLFYHSIRNLKLSLLKIIDRFKQAKAKQLNPLIAMQLKEFIKYFMGFLIFLKRIQQKELYGIDILSDELERFRNKTREYLFLCNTDEEFRYDNIPEEEFERLFKSIQENNIDKDEIYDVNEGK